MLISDLKLLLRFKSTSLYEEVSGTTMFARGDFTNPIILSSGGYTMSNSQYLVGEGIGYAGYNTGISSSMTIGFWLYSVNPGLSTNPSSGDATPVIMPVMNFNEIGSNNTSIIDITEITTVDGYNSLNVSLSGGVYSVSSENYSPNMWHHFWISYDGLSSLVLFVDGIQQTLQNEQGLLPASISGNYLDLYINNSMEGYSYNLGKNYGYITDIFMLNVSNINERDIQRVVNDGVEYLVDDNYTDIYVEKSSIYFNDPDTITITSSIDDMSYVYLGRNDGKILRGSPLLWETRISFSDNSQPELLGLSDSEKGSKWDVNNGFLEIINKNIRL
jgi:hypothetical protein